MPVYHPGLLHEQQLSLLINRTTTSEHPGLAHLILIVLGCFFNCSGLVAIRELVAADSMLAEQFWFVE